MIKRLKWNVLHGSDNDDGAGDLVSSGSEEEYEEVARQLAQLAKNDPDMQTMHGESNEQESDGDDFLRDEYSESEDDEKVAGFDELAVSVANQKLKKKQRSAHVVKDGEGDAGSESGSGEDALGEEQEEEEEEFVEWRECNLCPGKRFLNDAEVESHLLSKGHNRALKKYERLQKEKEAAAEAEQAQGSDADIERDVEDFKERSGSEYEAVETEKDSPRKRRKAAKTKLLAEHCGSGQMPLRGGVGENSTLRGDRVVNGASDAHKANRMQDVKGDSSNSDAAKRKKLAAKNKLKRMKERKWKRQQELLKNQSSPVENAAKEKAEKANMENPKKTEADVGTKVETNVETKVDSKAETKTESKI